MLAGLPVPAEAVEELAGLVRATGGDMLCRPARAGARRRREALALTLDERAVMLSSLVDLPKALAELRAVLLNEHQWRQREGLDSPLPAE